MHVCVTILFCLMISCGSAESENSYLDVKRDGPSRVVKKEYVIQDSEALTVELKVGLPISVFGMSLGFELESGFMSSTSSTAKIFSRNGDSVELDGASFVFRSGTDLKLVCQYATELSYESGVAAETDLAFIGVEGARKVAKSAEIKISSQAFPLEDGDTVDSVLEFCRDDFEAYHLDGIKDEAANLIRSQLKLDGSQSPVYKMVHMLSKEGRVSDFKYAGYKWTIRSPQVSTEFGLTKSSFYIQRSGFLSSSDLDFDIYHQNGKTYDIQIHKTPKHGAVEYRELVTGLIAYAKATHRVF